jgi:nucleoside-diphosphate-sugar epimerase
MILVTGGTGFLGSHLLAKLMLANSSVRALKRENSSLEQVKRVFAYYKIPELYNKIEWVIGDLLDYGSLLDATEGITQVYHTAAFVTFQKADPKIITRTNIKGTSLLVDACLTNGVQRFCHVSSIAALGVTEDNSMIKESTEWKSKKSNSTYSIGKYYSELHAWRAFSEGMTGVVVCPSVIIGPENNNSGISPLFGMVKKGLNYYPSGSNGFVDVRDVADVMIMLTNNTEITNEKFIVNSENITYKKLLEIISEKLNKPSPVKVVSKSKLKTIAFLNNMFSSNKKITKTLIGLISSNYLYSNNKIVEATGIRFKTIEESVNDIL